MNRQIGFAAVVALIVAVIGCAPRAVRADEAPARNAEVWNGVKHPPAPAELQQREQAYGVAAPSSEQSRETGDVERMAGRLLEQENANHPGVGSFGDGTSITH
jgi:hypothetical protein